MSLSTTPDDNYSGSKSKNKCSWPWEKSRNDSQNLCSEWHKGSSVSQASSRNCQDMTCEEIAEEIKNRINANLGQTNGEMTGKELSECGKNLPIDFQNLSGDEIARKFSQWGDSMAKECSSTPGQWEEEMECPWRQQGGPGSSSNSTVCSIL